MTFSDQLRAFNQKTQRNLIAIEDGVVAGVEQSVVRGSPLTGSPGQPEDLRNGQWVTTKEAEHVTVISCDDHSARAVETGISSFDGHPIKFHSATGGEHSLALTELGFPNIVADVARRVLGAS